MSEEQTVQQPPEQENIQTEQVPQQSFIPQDIQEPQPIPNQQLLLPTMFGQYFVTPKTCQELIVQMQEEEKSLLRLQQLIQNQLHSIQLEEAHLRKVKQLIEESQVKAQQAQAQGQKQAEDSTEVKTEQ
ncbi:uncharacterized protein MONOS_3288 [Monocercomonoides exilis]|uniref:uncharacterized protein n=1 Tax=Monocercomonoides exilis TaxID=2049356 RepID=UPI003559EAF1|nr:hypothetical protein MONOS_3288 [Monocercomonoides exilis]|eukprot:MONOS_3288.1-p1 / transcript=MONOS_3288.1 / gene=MONOS_3288 / organism=Monocercomonoides_exilis_PA203 / gene_product=unspecified product / transcript_product=unspecified product / location=Mono_scaffold00076:57054-57605(+) / protein_length=129 / sequence_SO=supercontig / SO=protein_coding / is_pseudo=false